MIPFLMEQLRELLNKMKDETIKELEKDNKKLSDRLQALETIFDKPPASYCTTHERTYFITTFEERRKEKKGK